MSKKKIKIINKLLKNKLYISNYKDNSSEDLSLSESSISDYNILDIDIDSFIEEDYDTFKSNIPNYAQPIKIDEQKGGKLKIVSIFNNN